MITEATIRRFPRLARTLLAIAEEADPSWAISVINAAMRNKSGMAHALVREAWKKRSQYRGASEALRAIGVAVDAGESSLFTKLPHLLVQSNMHQ